jgi:hypothetical protein
VATLWQCLQVAGICCCSIVTVSCVCWVTAVKNTLS